IASASTDGLTERATAEVLGVADRALLSSLGRAVLEKNAEGALEQVDAAFVRGYDLPQLAHAFLGYLRDLVVAASVKDPSNLIEASAGEIDELKAQVKKLPVGLAELLFDRFVKVAEEVAKSPVPRYVLEVGLVELTRVEPLEPISGLIAKLENLESRVEKGGGRSVAPSAAAPAPAPAQTPVAPAPVAAPKPAPAVPTKFTDLVDALLAVDGLLAPLAQGRLIAWGEKLLTIGFDKEFAADGLNER